MGFKIYNFIDYTFQSKFDNIYPMSVARLATHAKGERELGFDPRIIHSLGGAMSFKCD